MRRTPTATSSRTDAVFDDDETLALPAVAEPPRRTAVPLLASIVPVVGAAALWLTVGSTTMLWFAALGPLIAVATLADGARTARRTRRRAGRETERARERLSSAIDRRHAGERAELWARHPDVAGLLAVGADGADAVWRRVPGRTGVLVAGRGAVRSTVRVSGISTDAESLALKRRATTLTAAPVTVPAAAGIAVVGPEVSGAAVARALALQLVLAAPPGDVRVIGPATGRAAWTESLPHRRARAGATMGLSGPGDAVRGVDVAIAHVLPGSPPPPACGAVLTLTGIGEGVLVSEGATFPVEVEAVSAEQAEQIAVALALRDADSLGGTGPGSPVDLVELLEAAPPPRRDGLPALVALAGETPFVIDLASDGPHAVVVGMTGAGKSELLTTWVTSLCATHSTEEVVFLLADFKGGTAFEALSATPHVTGVITDLDGGGARRALESLRAELRRREGELVRAGARDIADDGVRLPRLVVVVDEFAALASAHPELPALFTDIAARGRALGMHLILGTQRATGVVRDALMANCPLRICLRVTDAGDSRAVIGTDDAARLPGDAASRGMALVRRAADAEAQTVRIALTSSELIRATAARTGGPRPRSPWLPELPARITLDDLVARATRRRAAGDVLLGLADEPDLQRQSTVVLRPDERGLAVVGGVGSGRTSVLATVAAQAAHSTWIGAEPEAAWDALHALVQRAPAAGHAVLIDDLDALLGRLPVEYAHVAAERIERLLRGAGESGARVVVSTQRLSGAVARLIELLPRRAVLAMASRAEHLAAGGEPGEYRDRLPPGRGVLDGRTVQFCQPPTSARAEPSDPAPLWRPCAAVTGMVLRSGAAVRRWTTELAAGADGTGAHGTGARAMSVDEAAADPGALAGGGSGPPVVVIGDAEAWQRAWRILSVVRAEHDLIIDADCAGDYRILTGDREPPPYCEPGRRRAWLLRSDGSVGRVRMARDA